MGSCAVRVRMGRRQWTLTDDEVLTFGRSRDRDVRLGHDPEDDYVSRHAGEISRLSGGVLVRNSSKTQSLLLRPLPGPEVRIAPSSGVLRSTRELFQLVVPGRYGGSYTMLIDGRPPQVEGALAENPVAPLGAVPTRAGASRLTARERRMLAALCEPRLLNAGEEARPATYGEVAERLGTTTSSVKGCLDNLRHRLSDEDGIPGLRTEEDKGRDAANYLVPLVEWAVDTGAVSLDELRVVGYARHDPA